MSVAKQLTVNAAWPQVNYLLHAAQLLVQAKVKEIKYKARQRARQEAAAAQGSGVSMAEGDAPAPDDIGRPKQQ